MTVGFVSSLCAGRRKGVEFHMRETYDLDTSTIQMCSHSMCLLGSVHAAQHKRSIVLWLLCVRKVRLRKLLFLE